MSKQSELLILGIGVSEYETDGVLRFESFCDRFALNHMVLGKGKQWHGGDMANTTGGGQKINELASAIEMLDNGLIIVCDTFDLFPVASKAEIIEKYHSICLNNEVLFSTEVCCWPDKSLATQYPPINTKYKFLNSGSIMGYRDDIYELIKTAQIEDADDDQLFFTKKFLSGEKIILDYNCELFQTLNGVGDDLVLFKNRIYNKYTNTYPVFIHGNGPSKKLLNHFENFLDQNPKLNFSIKNSTGRHISSRLQSTVFFALYIDSSVKDNINLFLVNALGIDWSNKIVYIYDKNFDENICGYVSGLGFKYVSHTKSYTITDFIASKADFYFLLEQQCMITNPNVLHELVPLCRDYHRVIAPLLKGKTNNYFTNYWGDINGNGFYKRSDNYIDLINYGLRGLWNCPYVSGAILINRDIMLNWNITNLKEYDENNKDMQLCYNLRKNTLFMYMCNLSIYGYLL